MFPLRVLCRISILAPYGMRLVHGIVQHIGFKVSILVLMRKATYQINHSAACRSKISILIPTWKPPVNVQVVFPIG